MNGNGLSIDEEMTRRLGGDIRMNMHSGNLEQGAAMFIRGFNSINANAQPLVILDGVELDMQRDRESLHLGDIFNMLSTIAPEDIDKVTVLKNATALYGARGANGVILIDTKRGHSMATRIDAKLGVGWTFTPNYPTMMIATMLWNSSEPYPKCGSASALPPIPCSSTSSTMPRTATTTTPITTTPSGVTTSTARR